MSGIPHIYDSPHMFDITEDYDDEPTIPTDDYYDELAEKIEQYLIEENILLKRILKEYEKMEDL